MQGAGWITEHHSVLSSKEGVVEITVAYHEFINISEIYSDLKVPSTHTGLTGPSLCLYTNQQKGSYMTNTT